MSKIKSIHAREILDSRGNPTIEVHIELSSGAYGYAQVPSGASIGAYEAWELRDGGKRYQGRGVLKAVGNINEILARKLYGTVCTDIQKVDEIMIEIDGTKNKKHLGANAILAVSQAVVRAAADNANLSLNKFIEQSFVFKNSDKIPRPLMNVINGGRHADNNVSIQEFMIIPNASNFSKMLQMGVEVYHTLHNVLKTKKLITGLGDEGGYAPRLAGSEAALELLVLAIKQSGYTPGKDINLGIDAAASEFFIKNKYIFEGKKITAQKLGEIYSSWSQNYPIVLIEDGFDQDDWKAWQAFYQELGDNIVLVGDDLFATNKQRLEKGIGQNVANAILIKPNQIGSVSETISVIKIAQAHQYKVIISHRSGETGDDFIADLAVGVGADFIKAGAPARGERVVKYNRLLAIYENK